MKQTQNSRNTVLYISSSVNLYILMQKWPRTSINDTAHNIADNDGDLF